MSSGGSSNLDCSHALIGTWTMLESACHSQHTPAAICLVCLGIHVCVVPCPVSPQHTYMPTVPCTTVLPVAFSSTNVFANARFQPPQQQAVSFRRLIRHATLSPPQRHRIIHKVASAYDRSRLNPVFPLVALAALIIDCRGSLHHMPADSDQVVV